MNSIEKSESDVDSVFSPGSFAIPNTDSFSGRAGAEAGKIFESSYSSRKSEDSDFPMIVWLRGDEPWFSQFVLDAESVMKSLGIKRSRLTQISGRELRVGRVRVDRYIKPVYRDIDVQNYLSWTRATASHQKASNAIKDAVSQLSDQSLSISASLESVTSNLPAQIKFELLDSLSQLIHKNFDAFEKTVIQKSELTIQSEFQACKADFHEKTVEVSNQFQDALNKMTQSVELIFNTIQSLCRQQAAAIESMTLQINQISEVGAKMNERQFAWDNLLNKNISDMKLDLAQLKAPKKFKKRANSLPKTYATKSQAPSKTVRIAIKAAPNRRKPKI